jgi:Holliday junction DNA helicase RuvA
MIARLRGTLLVKTPGEIVVDVGGVGYRVFVSLSTFTTLPGVGREVTLDVHTHVRDDALQLYGFASPKEKQVFELMIGVAGIGPKLATNVLSGIPADDMVDALIAGNVARLVSVPGVGRKLAERLTVELRERAVLLRNGRNGAPGDGGAGGRAASDVLREATSALVNLGYRPAEAERAVKGAASQAGERLEDIIRLALQGLAG